MGGSSIFYRLPTDGIYPTFVLTVYAPSLYLKLKVHPFLEDATVEVKIPKTDL